MFVWPWWLIFIGIHVDSAAVPTLLVAVGLKFTAVALVLVMDSAPTNDSAC